jgi:hypothetical protein
MLTSKPDFNTAGALQSVEEIAIPRETQAQAL